jgi:hypothetical protein
LVQKEFHVITKDSRSAVAKPNQKEKKINTTAATLKMAFFSSLFSDAYLPQG